MATFQYTQLLRFIFKRQYQFSYSIFLLDNIIYSSCKYMYFPPGAQKLF